MIENTDDLVTLDCNFNFLAFIFDVGPFGRKDVKEIHADTVEPRSNFDFEVQIKSEQKDIELRKIFYEYFQTLIDLTVDENAEQALIVIITIAISLALAIDNKLRLAFYASFQGRIPRFTQELFEIIGIGRLKSNLMIKTNSLANKYVLEIRYALFLGMSCIDPELESNELGFNGALLWFDLLSKSEQKGQVPYLPLTTLKPEPILKTSLSPLYDLWISDGKIWWRTDSSFQDLDNPVLKQKLFLYAVVFDIRLSNEHQFYHPSQFNYTMCKRINEIWPNDSSIVKDFITLIFEPDDLSVKQKRKKGRKPKLKSAEK